MPELTVENLFNQIAQLPPPEQSRLRNLLDKLLNPAPVRKETAPIATENGEPSKKRLEPIQTPDRTREMRWLKDHGRQYAGQWVALDGDRLIAHGADAKAVFAAAKADGAFMPLVDSVTDPDRPFVF